MAKQNKATGTAAIAPYPTKAQLQAAGITFSQLIITQGPNATINAGTSHPARANSARLQRMAMLPKFYGQSVAAYIKAASAAVPGGRVGNNNPQQAHKVGFITLKMPN